MPRTSWPEGTPVEDIARDLGYDVLPFQAAGGGNPEALAAYWEDKMSCSPGDFEECVQGVSQYVDDPEGYCQERHIAACGEPAGKGAHGGAVMAGAEWDAEVDVPQPYPASWFEKPDWLEPGQGHTVLDSGQCAGYWYPRGACIIGQEGACPTPSPTGYRAFKQGSVTVAGLDGTTQQLEAGVIGQVGGHASPYASTQAASEHYNNPGQQRIVCVLGDDEHGGWYAGGLVPGLSRRQVEEVRRSSLSGDWRPMPKDWWDRNGVSAADVRAAEGYDSLGPTLVSRPALPMVKAYPVAASLPVLLGALEGEPCEDCQDSEEASVPNIEDAVREAVAAELAQRDAAAAQEQVRTRVDGLAPVDLPAPAGFEERVSHLTAADLEHLARQAAPAPSPKSAPDRPADQRKKDASSGVALPDGSFPIRNCGDWMNARRAVGRANPGDRAKVQAHIAARGKALGCGSTNGNG